MSMSVPRVVVVGAGAFGGWTALDLVRRGAAVTLLDAWGAGNLRASSGGSTRVIRATYGSHDVYTRMAVAALQRWRDYDARWNAGLLHQTGALWLFGADTTFGDASEATLQAAGVPIETVAIDDAATRFPQVAFEGITRVLFEPDAGYLRARRACAHVAERVGIEGGVVRCGAAASPARVDRSALWLNDGSRVEADAFVFACGPWLGGLFPDLLGDRIVVTRQEVYYFGQPAGDARFQSPALPVWLECGERFIYGIPTDGRDGFKIADDSPGPRIDPDIVDRTAGPEGVEAARRYLSRRFPGLSSAPLLRTEVCQYESTPDAHFVIDRHPAHPHVWIAGGGSGHGFKMGPVVGEMVADLVLGQAAPHPRFSIGRFATPPAEGWQQKWA
jgi:glycine/D-amino acid oxidase-like deaminating enzyme